MNISSLWESLTKMRRRKHQLSDKNRKDLRELYAFIARVSPEDVPEDTIRRIETGNFSKQEGLGKKLSRLEREYKLLAKELG